MGTNNVNGEENFSSDVAEVIETPQAEQVTRDKANLAAPAVVSRPSIVTVVLLSVFISALSIATYDFFIAQKIVTINVQKYIDDQRQLYLAGKLSSEEVTRNLDGLIRSMKNAPKNKVIILEDVVANSSEKFEPK